MAEAHGLEVVEEYEDYASGGNSNRPGFQKMLSDARERKFSIILIWSLDRFSREGISNTFHYLERLKKYDVALRSFQEKWLDTSDELFGGILIAVLGWVAERERKRISERTKAGLDRAKRDGKKLGRPNGGGDKGRRKRSGYLLRWQRKEIGL